MFLIHVVIYLKMSRTLLSNILKYYNLSTVLQYRTPAVPHMRQGNLMLCGQDAISQQSTMSWTKVGILSAQTTIQEQLKVNFPIIIQRNKNKEKFPLKSYCKQYNQVCSLQNQVFRNRQVEGDYPMQLMFRRTFLYASRNQTLKALQIQKVRALVLFINI